MRESFSCLQHDCKMLNINFFFPMFGFPFNASFLWLYLQNSIGLVRTQKPKMICRSDLLSHTLVFEFTISGLANKLRRVILQLCLFHRCGSRCSKSGEIFPVVVISRLTTKVRFVSPKCLLKSPNSSNYNNWVYPNYC